MSKSSEINAKDWYTGTVFNKLYNSGFNKIILTQSHKLLERNRKNYNFPITLELGATKGYHFEFIEHDFNKYVISDLFLTNELIELGERNSNLEVKQLDANDLSSFKSGEIDRIVTTCLLQHLPDAEKVIHSIIEKLKIQTGVFDTLLSNTETVLWQIGRLLLIAPKLIFTKYSLKSYFAFYRSDHVNSCERIINMFRAIDNIQVEVNKFPLNLLPNALTIYYRISIKKLS